MAQSAHALEFSYNRMLVGYFQEDTFPTGPGRYRYMPYRGMGHYRMSTQLRQGSRPKCTFVLPDRKTISFVAVEIPEYGVLKIEDVERDSSAVAGE